MEHRELKLIILGGGGVGKSAIVIRKTQDVFLTEYDPTIEDSYRFLMKIDGQQVMLDALDTGGDEEFSPMRDLYMRTSDGCIIVYSITNRSSFLESSCFYEQIKRVKNTDFDNGCVPIIIVGNKLDLEEDREVTTKEGQELADSWGVDFYECSAKEDINITELFECIGSNIINYLTIQIDSTYEKNKRCFIC
ncbi:Ras small monomeric GTPase [Entamoeba marina]